MSSTDLQQPTHTKTFLRCTAVLLIMDREFSAFTVHHQGLSNAEAPPPWDLHGHCCGISVHAHPSVFCVNSRYGHVPFRDFREKTASSTNYKRR